MSKTNYVYRIEDSSHYFTSLNKAVSRLEDVYQCDVKAIKETIKSNGSVIVFETESGAIVDIHKIIVL